MISVGQRSTAAGSPPSEAEATDPSEPSEAPPAAASAPPPVAWHRLEPPALRRARIAVLGVLARPSTQHRLARLLLAALGAALAFRAFEGTWAQLGGEVNAFDEGIVLSGSSGLLAGKLPYRDFFSNYAPGIYLLLAGAFEIAGQSVAVERLVGVGLHLAVSIGAGATVARLLGGSFSWLLAALVLMWLGPLGTAAIAWLAGLGVAVLACDRWAAARERDRPRDYLIAGCVLGAVSWFRHDLFAYFSCGLAGLGVIWVVLASRRGDRSALRVAGWTLLGAVSAVCLMWLPTFALTGVRQPFEDLFLDMVRYVMPARHLPVPPLFTWVRVNWAPFSVPVFALQLTESAIVLTYTGPLVAAAAWLFPERAGLKRRSEVAWLGVLSVAVLPQMLGRTDLWHAIYTVTPALMVWWLWIDGKAVTQWRAGDAARIAFGTLLLFLPSPRLPAHRVRLEMPDWKTRAGGTPISEARSEVFAFIDKHTKPGDPIYFGYTNHRRVFISEVDIYFLADRTWATRYTQFEPNVVNREDAQRLMIADLEKTRPRVAILATRGNMSGEPNDSRKEGSPLLDKYIKAHYKHVKKTGHYVLALRK